MLTIETPTYKIPITYNIKVFLSSGNCSGKQIRTITISVPAYNSYSTNSYCKAFPEFKYCKKFMDTSNLNINEFTKKFNDYITKQNQGNEESKKFDFLALLKNKWTIGTACLLLLIGIGIGIYAFYRKKIAKI